ncbi:MAG TPA: zinc metallopeptidase [Gemmataceae bacterium]|nr:zinc metallopeptidase [Gemmataceae bacterium]
MYLLFLGPGMLLALWARFKVKHAYAETSQIPARSGYSGAEAAHALMESAGIHNVAIEPVQGYLSDHYAPKEKVLRLSPDVFSGHSLAALGIAAHETGHALQDAHSYGPLRLRSLLVPVAGFGSNAAWIILVIGFALNAMGLILAGIIVFSGTVLFQLVNLPVEFDASRRARRILLDNGLIAQDEDYYVKKVLDAAALTYVAATLTSVLTLLYFLFRSGLLGGRRG